MDNSNITMIMAFATVIIAVLTIAVLVLRWFAYRERMALIKQGLGNRVERNHTFSADSKATLAWGVGIVLVGVALILGLMTVGIGPWLLFGLIPLGAGIALIAAHLITSGSKQPETGLGEQKVAPESAPTWETSGSESEDVKAESETTAADEEHEDDSRDKPPFDA